MWRRAQPLLIAALCAAACQVDIDDYTQRACDADHSCLAHYQCVQGRCTADADVTPTQTLRVVKTGSQFTYQLSQDGEASWTAVGSFTQPLTITRAGPYVGNAGLSPTTSATFGTLGFPESGALTLVAPGGPSRDCWSNGFNCVNALQPIPGTDGTYQVTFSSPLFSDNFQTAGLMFYQDNTNFLRFDFYSDSTGVFADAWSVLGGTGTQVVNGPKISPGLSNGIRVVKSGNAWSYQFSIDGGGTWRTAGTVSAFLSLQQAGPYVTNSSTTNANSATFGAMQFPGNGALSLSAPAGSPHDCTAGSFQCISRLQPVPGGDGTYQVSIRNLAIAGASQFAGVMLYQDTNNFLRFELWTGGSGVFADAYAVIGGAASQPIMGPQVTLRALPDVPAAASNLSAVPLSSSSVQLSWLDNSTNETTFRILRRATQTSDPLAEIAQAPANSTSFVDTGLNANWQYDYQVIARNNAGDAPPSNTITVQVLP
jgi:hypothetical protein